MHLHVRRALLGVSFLPALLIVPALGERLVVDVNQVAPIPQELTKTYSGNTGFEKGGGIWNKGTVDAYTITVKNNAASDLGGGVYNERNMTLHGSTIGGTVADKNTAIYGGGIANGTSSSAILTLNNKVIIKNNEATSHGGGVYNYEGIVISDGTEFISNLAELGGGLYSYSYGNNNNPYGVILNGDKFTGNRATEKGGAAYVYKGSFDGVTFYGNSAKSGGGVYIKETLSTQARDANIVMTDVTFERNLASAGDGGAIYNNHNPEHVVGGLKDKLTISGNSLFVDNEASDKGGAIMNKGSLEITGAAEFTDNSATSGGAIYNEADYKSVINGATFTENSAVNGGAIYNLGTFEIEDTSFTGNAASTAGGAIYNDGVGVLRLYGTNSFSNNAANGSLNDITNNAGMFVLGGTTTIDGGISGANGELTIAEGATLNIGTASISQEKIRLDGNMTATLRTGDTAQITVTDLFDGTGTLSLLMKDTGTYKVFGGEVFANTDVVGDSNFGGATLSHNGVAVTDNPVFDLEWTNSGKDLSASLKSVDKIASENGLSVRTANVIADVATSSSEALQEVNVLVQQKLLSGTDADKAAVAHASDALQPETKSVVQSVSGAIQDAVVNLASSRMASVPTFGRSGGDLRLNATGGVWAQGIFNKSKQNGVFSGYTRGIAVGVDSTINKKVIVGLGYAFNSSDVAGHAHDTDIDTSTIFVYGQYKPAEWYVNGIISYSYSDYSEKADVLGLTKTADYKTKTWGTRFAAGYDFKNGITPEFGLRYARILTNDYIDSFGVKNRLNNSDYLTADLGAKYAANIKADKLWTLTPEVRAGVKCDLFSDKQVATVSMPGVAPYSIHGERLSRLAGDLGFGVTANYKTMKVSLNYDLEVREDYTSQTGRIKFRYDF